MVTTILFRFVRPRFEVIGIEQSINLNAGNLHAISKVPDDSRSETAFRLTVAVQQVPEEHTEGESVTAIEAPAIDAMDWQRPP